ncbi:hypothetical protein [Metabacillus elymi]|uniref:Uncharacterized protein n=1 Tax=Metabacillus elymi TaxID=2745198 RepID=A0ABX6S6I9_9BACI|nr:hypothetical protein [Metabacillus sp. KUDC1714]QNF29634.1 hypothetical protein HUW50_20350 [Metabacillus sp. KUDC1714]
MTKDKKEVDKKIVTEDIENISAPYVVSNPLVGFESSSRFSEKIASISNFIGQLGKAAYKFSKALSKALAPLFEIDWESVGREWVEMAEAMAQKGWTIPTNIGINELLDVIELDSQLEVDNYYKEFYSDEKNYLLLKDNIINHQLLSEWQVILEQCFENFEKGNHVIIIPSLFTVLEGLSHKLIYPKFKPHETKKRKSLPKQFETVRAELTESNIDLAFYASAQVFITQAFRFAAFEEDGRERPFLINRNWVLHGRDIPSQWKDIDALRLFNALDTLTILEFLLEETT